MKVSYSRFQDDKRTRKASICLSKQRKENNAKEKNLKLKASQKELQALAERFEQAFSDVQGLVKSVTNDWSNKYWSRTPALAPVDIVDEAAKCPSPELKERIRDFIMDYAKEKGFSASVIEIYSIHLDAWNPYAVF